ncbi:MAG: ASKHA domain-containing protein [Alphaproteobacteria bacterium]|nr:ASKHA domain-containing protein [Alphaproteobacteria bacterium]
MTDNALIVFTPSGKRGRFPVGTPILQAAQKLGVDLDSICGGRGLCGRCQVTLGEGEFAKHGITSRADHATPGGEVEARYDQRKGLKAGRRLGCQARLQGDLVVDVPAESQVHRQLVRKRAEVRDIELDPVVTLHYVEVEPPDMHAQAGDLRRLERALENQWQLTGLSADLRVMQYLQPTLREAEWGVTAAVHAGERIIAVWPGLKEEVYGIAFDVGSTTIAGHLVELRSGEVKASAGLMNPQIRFGEDLMSRVSYVMMNPGGDQEMTTAVREAITAMIGQLAAEAMIDPSEIMDLTFVGNPVMHHLLLGIDPTELGGAPFALATDEPVFLWASELSINVTSPSARAYILPCIAGHVGADAAGVILSETPHLNDEMTLIVDVGTNAEIILGNRHRLMAASSPTGPAFEGAQISCGQRAATGAIERVRIDPETLEPRIKLIGADSWSDDAAAGSVDFDEAGHKRSAASGATGICGSGIIEVIAEMYLAGIIKPDGTIDGAKAAINPRIQEDGRTFSYLIQAGEPEIRITQNDIRAIQLAKAALYAGARLLMDHMGVDQVERITLAGAFGSHIDVKYAMILGLIPDCDLAKVTSAGNAAGTGARIALLNRKSRREIEALVSSIEKVETAVEPRFQEHFVKAMAIPHADADFSNLKKVVILPERTAEPEAGGRRERRRRRA